MLDAFRVKACTIQRAVGFLVRYEDHGDEAFATGQLSHEEARELGGMLIGAADKVQAAIEEDGVTRVDAARMLLAWYDRFKEEDGE